MELPDNRSWLHWHAFVAPLGILITTFGLAWIDGLDHWSDAAGFVELGVIVYAVIGSALEGGINMVFWALEQRRRRLAGERRRLAEKRSQILTDAAAALRKEFPNEATAKEAIAALEQQAKAPSK